MKELDLTKEYVCNSCGAPLKVDEEHQVLICKYCGVTHDYAYFMQNDSIFIGYSFLEARNFTSATKTFSFILKRDPHNALALRGMLFAALKIRRLRELDVTRVETDPNKLRAIRQCIKRAQEKDKGYFNNFQEIFEISDRLKDLKIMISDLRQRDTTHMEYTYGTKEENKLVMFEEKFSDTLRWLFFGVNGKLSVFGKLVAFVDIVCGCGLLWLLFDSSNWGTEKMGACPWLLAIMFVLSYLIPRIIWLIRGIKRKSIKRKILKSARLVEDKDVRSKIAMFREEFDLLSDRLKEISIDLNAKDLDYKARQGN